MRELSFSIEAARRYGVDGAILLHGMAAWISKNRANQRHFHDGRWWTYNSKAALARLFPFWTEKQLRRIVKALNEEGALLLGSYSDGSLHNTTWYALSDNVLELLGAEECASASFSQRDSSRCEDGERDLPHQPPVAAASPRGSQDEDGAAAEDAPESTCPNGQVQETTCPNGQVDLPKRAEDKQVNTNNNPPISPPKGAAIALAELAELLEGWYGGRSVPADDQREALRLYSDLRLRASRWEIEEQLTTWVAALGPGALPLREVLRNDTWREDPWFWLFWQQYPRKIDKDRARRAWKKIKPARAMALAILQSLRAWKLCDQWQDERFIPYPATWLNGRRWEASPPGGRAAAQEPPEREVEEWT